VTRHHPGFVRRLVALLSVLGLVLLERSHGAEADPSDALFSGPVQTLALSIPDSQKALLLTSRGMNDERPEAVGTVQVGTNIFTNVLIHLKGSGSFRPIQYRPSLTLKFKSAHPFFGLTKLHLNNSVHDPGRINEVLGSELHRRAGIPTPRATPVRVSLNNLDLGVYVLKEGFDKRFLARHFAAPNGNLYDPKWAQDIDSDLEADSGPATKPPINLAQTPANNQPSPQVDRIQLLKATRAAPENRLAALERRLDVDRFLTTMALQILLDDWDGYARHHNNYRLYRDPEQSRFVFLPHGMDLLMGTPRSVIYWPELNGLVARALFTSPGGPERLKSQIQTLQKDVFTETNLVEIIQRTENRLQAALAGEPDRVRDFYRHRADSLIRRVHDRCEMLRNETAGGLNLEIGKHHRLEGWEPWAERPETDLEETKDTEGRPVLRIRAKTRATYGSWRTRLVLAPGDYQFSGIGRLEKVRAWDGARDPGVGIRVVPGRRGNGATGTLDEQAFSYGFHLNQTNEVAFVLELSAHSGQVDYFKDSLRVTRTSAK
jgi:hypothetical protein